MDENDKQDKKILILCITVTLMISWFKLSLALLSISHHLVLV